MAKKNILLSDLDQARKTGFIQGYVIACANVMNLHDDSVVAQDTLAESGITLAEVKALDLTEYDMKPLRALFREIARKRKIKKERAARAPKVPALPDPSARPAPLAREGKP